ncbi:MAG: tRNA (cytidine(56)-2'-O)-methyltransferase [Candidatus Micrarchaeota archaeon]
MGLWVLRYGHRRGRDPRASMHVLLAARALGAEGAILCGEEDAELVGRVEKIVENWGGPFDVRYEKDWMDAVEKFKKNGGCFVNLTMYGLPVQDVMDAIRKKSKDCLVLVGSQKVPTEAYTLADFNVSVSSQPHSEIAALAVFLDRYCEGRELAKRWEGKIQIKPAKVGKDVKMSKK